MATFKIQCHPGIVYAAPGGTLLTLDLYLSQNAPGRRPVVVYMHGGGWVRGSSGSPSTVHFALEMAGEGIAVAAINYRKADVATAPAAIEDAKSAVRWVRANVQKYSFDAKRVVAMGNSAGGHLALMLALTKPKDGFEGEGNEGFSTDVMACCNLCGITDLESLVNDKNIALWAKAWVPADAPDRLGLARQVSPLTYVSADAPPVLIVHGDQDEDVPYSQSERLYKKLTKTGGDAQLVTVKSAGHMLGITGAAHVQDAVRDARRAFFKRIGILDDE